MNDLGFYCEMMENNADEQLNFAPGSQLNNEKRIELPSKKVEISYRLKRIPYRLLKAYQDADYINLLYRLFLGRQADRSELNGYLRNLRLGYVTKYEIAEVFSKSDETKERGISLKQSIMTKVLLRLNAKLFRIPKLGRVYRKLYIRVHSGNEQDRMRYWMQRNDDQIQDIIKLRKKAKQITMVQNEIGYRRDPEMQRRLNEYAVCVYELEQRVKRVEEQYEYCYRNSTGSANQGGSRVTCRNAGEGVNEKRT